MKKVLMILAIGFSILGLYAYDVNVVVYSNAEANGNVMIFDNSEQLNYPGWCEDHFNNGSTLFTIPVDPTHDVGDLSAHVYGGTSWGSWYIVDNQTGFEGNPPTVNVHLDFDSSLEVALSINTNSDAENCTISLYNSIGTLIEDQTVDLDNKDYNHNSLTTEVIFEDIILEVGSFENLSATISGTNVYGNNQTESTVGSFTWNSSSEAFENSIDLVYTLPSDEVKKYNSGWNWISYPRLHRAADNGFDAEIVVDDLESYSLEVKSEGNGHNMVFDPNTEIWNHNYLNDFKSSEGYKLLMNSTLSEYSHKAYGTKLPDQYQVSLTGNTIENWVGYWIDDTQIISDALGDYWTDTNVRTIKMQYWSADRDPFNNDKWVCSGRIPTISYGDMVVIKCTNSIPYFKWDTGTPREKVTNPQAEYYTYTEQDDYTPLYLALDIENQPEEIGAFVDDQCIGATVVNDTLVQLNLYTDYRVNGEIEFEYCYGQRNSNTKVSKYKYHDLASSRASSGNISTARLKSAYLVDLRNQNEIRPEVENKLTANNYPNPFNPTTEISFSLPQTSNVDIKIYNVKGQEIITLLDNDLKEGNHSVVWNGKDTNNNSVSSGIYFYKISTKDSCLTKRMILMK